MGIKQTGVFAGALFAYKKGSSYIYRVPAVIKLLLLIPAGIAVWQFSVPAAAAAALLCTAALSRAAGFTFAEQLRSLLPAALYAPVLYAVTRVSAFVDADAAARRGGLWLIPEQAVILALVRMAAMLLLSQLLFCTTTMLELQQALSRMERTLRRLLSKLPVIGRRISKEPACALLLSLFLSFFPAIFRHWRNLDRSWRARGGKISLRKYAVLLPLLVSLSLHRAAQTAKAAANRSGS